jgi:uncharacterized damage-inducible protein DinB
MSNAVLVSLFEHKAWANQGQVEALRATPADADRRQLAVIVFTLDHTAIVDRIFRSRLLGGEVGIASVVADRWPDLDELAASMRETDAWYLDYVRAVTPTELEAVVEFTYVADGEPGRMTKAEMLAHVITHGAAHRGEIGHRLERLGVSGAPDMMTTFRRPAA